MEKQAALKREIVDKLQAIINSREDLWRAIGELTRTKDYIVAYEDFANRVLMELSTLEKHIGETEETRDLRARASSLIQPQVQQAPSCPVA